MRCPGGGEADNLDRPTWYEELARATHGETGR